MTTTTQEPKPTDAALDWFLASQPTLAADVESLPGLDGKPMLFNPDTGRYVSVTPAAVKISTRFDGTRSGRQILGALRLTPESDAARRIARMAYELRQAEFLTEPAVAEGHRVRASRFAFRDHMPRKELITNVSPLLEPVVRPLRRIGARPLVLGWSLVSVLGLLTGIWALTHVRVTHMPGHIWLLLPILAVQIAVHEGAHAVVCQYLGAPVRSAGVALMLYFMPVGYVDRTDTHRVQSRSGRTLIALAGPLSDQIWFGVAGVVALTAPTDIATMAMVLLVFQALLTVMNFNPFTPSDGYHAVTSAFGLVNLRGKSFALIVHFVTRAPLPPPLERTTTRERSIMVGYGIACFLFALLLAAVALNSVAHTIEVL